MNISYRGDITPLSNFEKISFPMTRFLEKKNIQIIFTFLGGKLPWGAKIRGANFHGGQKSLDGILQGVKDLGGKIPWGHRCARWVEF